MILFHVVWGVWLGCIIHALPPTEYRIIRIFRLPYDTVVLVVGPVRILVIVLESNNDIMRLLEYGQSSAIQNYTVPYGAAGGPTTV